ncbi:MAG: hypothetical protein HY897_05120 [Deltaproteobacteria bacterium]|nr:hypothetical protein [Deltaproteobacteria bacterium]
MKLSELRFQNADARAAAYGVIHFLVDAACVLAVERTGASTTVQALTVFWVILGYDVLAFALQAPLGALTDRLKLSRWVVYAGLGLTTVAVLTSRHAAIATMLAAGVGNALFHLGAGASVLRTSGGRATPAGLFVGPGALGLGLGLWMGRTGIGPAWPFVALPILSLPLVRYLHVDEIGTPASRESFGFDISRRVVSLALPLLLLSVAIRSFVGFGACRECPKGLLLAAGVPLAACAGKMLGGFISDRIGWIETAVGALLLSAPLVALNGGNFALAFPGLLLFQMTMPVTLVAVWRLIPEKPATAFGLPALALIIGAIPTFFRAGKHLFGPITFVALIVISAAALLVSLKAMGFGRGAFSPATAADKSPTAENGSGLTLESGPRRS